MRRAALLATVLLLTSCGRVQTGTGPDASAARTASPPALSPTPLSAVLESGNCMGSPSTSSSSTRMTARGIIFTIPPGWLDQTSQVTGEAALLRVQAPATYGSDDASFMVLAIPGHWIGSSARARAAEDAAGLASLGPQSSLNDCTVGGESASFYQYQDSAGNHVYRLLVLRCPLTTYPPLYAVVISSQGPVDDRAAADVRGILGSWNWGTNVCDLYK
jgi:hypothetical protein